MNKHVLRDLVTAMPAHLRMPYLQGRRARVDGRRLESCNLDNLTQASAWKCGWHDEDLGSKKRIYKVRRVNDGE